MVRYLGAFALSIIITNWLYAEFLLFVPEAEPVVARSLHYLTPPTHDTWGTVASDSGATHLASELQGMLQAGPLRVAFTALGVTDNRVQRVLKEGKSGCVESRSQAEYRPFVTGQDIFVSDNSATSLYGGYTRFAFSS